MQSCPGGFNWLVYHPGKFLILASAEYKTSKECFYLLNRYGALSKRSFFFTSTASPCKKHESLILL